MDHLRLRQYGSEALRSAITLEATDSGHFGLAALSVQEPARTGSLNKRRLQTEGKVSSIT